MNRLEHLLTIVTEECVETAQRVSKALRFGLAQVQQARDDKPEQNPERLNNRQRIIGEFHDLLATMDMADLIDLEIAGGMMAICPCGHPEPEAGEHPGVCRNCNGFIEDSPTLILKVPANVVMAKQAKIDHYLRMSERQGTLVD